MRKSALHSKSCSEMHIAHRFGSSKNEKMEFGTSIFFSCANGGVESGRAVVLEPPLTFIEIF